MSETKVCVTVWVTIQGQEFELTKAEAENLRTLLDAALGNGVRVKPLWDFEPIPLNPKPPTGLWVAPNYPPVGPDTCCGGIIDG